VHQDLKDQLVLGLQDNQDHLVPPEWQAVQGQQDRQARLVILVPQVQLDLQDPMGLPVPLVPLGLRVTMERQDRLVPLVPVVQLDSLGLLDSPGHHPPGPPDNQDQQVLLEQAVQPGRQDPMEPRDLTVRQVVQDSLVLRGLMATRDHRDLLVHQDRTETRDQLEDQDLLARRDLLVPQVLWVNQEVQVLPDLMVTLEAVELQGSLDPLERRVRRVSLVPKGLAVPQARRARLGRLVLREQREVQARQAHQGPRVNQDQLDRLGSEGSRDWPGPTE